MIDILLSIYNEVIAYVNLFLASTFFLVIKVIIAIYSAVLILNIILLTYLGDVRKRLRQLRYGTGNIPVQTKSEDQAWDEVSELLDTMDDQQWKIAVLKSEQIVDSELKRAGYAGENFLERVSQLPTGSSAVTEQVLQAHDVRNMIIRDESATVTHAQATDIVENMQSFLNDLGIRK